MEIEFRDRTSTIVMNSKKEVLVCLFKDPHNGKEYYVSPGGRIEEGESAADCAEREVLEESGYRVIVDKDSEEITSYDFPWDNKLLRCRGHWFTAVLADENEEPAVVDDVVHNLKYEWVSIDRAEELFSYHDHIKEMAVKYINKCLEKM